LQKNRYINETGTALGHVQKGLLECLCITVLVSSDPLFPYPKFSSATKTPANIEEDPDNPKPRRYPSGILL
jgi:hypothetical protein